MSKFEERVKYLTNLPEAQKALTVNEEILNLRGLMVLLVDIQFRHKHGKSLADRYGKA